MKQWQLKALIAALCVGGVVAIAQPATAAGTAAMTTPPSTHVDANGNVTAAPGKANDTRECTGLTGDQMTECIQKQQSGRRPGMTRGGGTGTGQGNGNGPAGSTGTTGTTGSTGTAGAGTGGAAGGTAGAEGGGTSGAGAAGGNGGGAGAGAGSGTGGGGGGG